LPVGQYCYYLLQLATTESRNLTNLRQLLSGQGGGLKQEFESSEQACADHNSDSQNRATPAANDRFLVVLDQLNGSGFDQQIIHSLPC
jgi:hypothetical protein